MKLKIKKLLEKHKQLEAETEAFILDAIRQNRGRITIQLESEEEYNSETSVTMYKKHGGSLNVNITDIYTIHGQNSTTDIKAAGFDCDAGFGRGTGFDVLPEHYYHILGIINTTLN